MKIKTEVVRECCQDRDLKPVEGCEMFNLKIPKLMFCIHCGHRHEFYKFMDSAGSMDWSYRKIKE